MQSADMRGAALAPTVTAWTPPPTVTHPRKVERIVAGQATSDGAGVKLTRVLTQDLQRRLDPFLMLDAFGTDNPGDYIGGFPDHPHRGFETVTYMLDGRMRHRDSAGNEGVAQQRRRAVDDRRARRHPQRDARAGRRAHGRLPAVAEPAGAGQDVRALVPRHSGRPRFRGCARPKASACTSSPAAATAWPVRCSARPRSRCTWTCTLPAGAVFEQPLPAAHNAFVYVYRGELQIAGQAVPRQRMAILANTAGSDGVRLQAGAQGARAILIAGQPLNEPIAQYGPFVMNSHEANLPGGGGLPRRAAG